MTSRSASAFGLPDRPDIDVADPAAEKMPLATEMECARLGQLLSNYVAGAGYR
ncbi:hypothetical protein [Neomesorhizobium albiziae]|uniref:hypothetical protein n=1 Tax=Neomesorhizobium albiziae TaxID=335020 RepID=UPI00165F7E97|nr:hypothetical protein [Mesorhizobium albiziae]GLS32555.1 hypothetical protein GCM10007937_42650 [Mesorhizobium albiziae]